MMYFYSGVDIPQAQQQKKDMINRIQAA